MDSAAFWDKVAEKYARDPIENMAGYLETRERIEARMSPQMRVLEIGCGTGTTAYELAPLAGHYRATDVSPNMIKIAEAKRTEDSPPHLEFAVADGVASEGEPYDMVLALNVLHLVKDLDAVLDQLHKSLVPGGCLIAKTAALKDGAWFLPYIIPVMRFFGKAPFVHCWHAADITARLEAAGFQIEDVLLQSGTAPRLFTIARKAP